MPRAALGEPAARHAEEFSPPIFPPSEPRQSADEQARNHNHHAGDEYGQAGKQQKVAHEKTHPRAFPLPPCAASMLTRRGIALRLMPDSRSITNYFALALVLWGAGFLQWGYSRRL